MYADNNTPVGIICKGKCVRYVKKLLHKPQGRPPTSDEKPPRRRWGSGDMLFSCYRTLAGAERAGGCCPPSSEGSPEVRDLRSPHLRRRHPSSELVLSSDERPSQRRKALRYSSSSCYRNPAGAERGFGCCPPTNKGSSEVRISHSPTSGETNPNRSWCLPPVSAFLNGGAVPTIYCPPVTGT